MFIVYGLDGSGLLKHLCEAGLLLDVSSLVGKAQARDEGNLRKVQVQARGEASVATIFSVFLLSIYFLTFINSVVHSFIYSFILSIHAFTHPFSFIHSFILHFSFIPFFIIYLFIHFLIHSFICFIIHSLVHSFVVEIDAQISTKLKEIDRMKLEVQSLRHKRKRCDEETDRLKKRLQSCVNVMKEIPVPVNDGRSQMNHTDHEKE